MQQRQRYETARQAIRELLQSGEDIEPLALAEAVGLTVPDAEAKTLWTRTVVSRLVHSTARDIGLMAMSLGPRRGLKAVRTAEDIEIAKARTHAALKGQAGRSRRLKAKLQDLNQLHLNLEEATSVAGADDSPKRLAAVSE